MGHYIYRLVVMNENAIIKSFLGNDINILEERYQLWEIKSSIDRYQLSHYIEYVQHGNN